jgi:DNA modification methylase
MIQMWDEMFCAGRPEIQEALRRERGNTTFELMHQALDPVWKECTRVLKTGGIACINIGDAVRTVDGDFRLYMNHVRILQALMKAGLSALPAILWRKQTNAPNKFMGSGMMPPGAYVTLEHEYVLVLRKGAKREFNRPMEKQNRLESAYFWEERNIWFSDVWMDLKGTVQKMVDPLVRKRSAAFPFELPYRLINMFSVKGDRVLDPFLGTGTTAAAAMAAARNSIGYEQDPALQRAVLDRTRDIVSFANTRIRERIEQHAAFVREREAGKGPLKHRNSPYGFPVMTKQEMHLLINPLEGCQIQKKNTVEVSYTDQPERIQMGLFNG